MNPHAVQKISLWEQQGLDKQFGDDPPTRLRHTVHMDVISTTWQVVGIVFLYCFPSPRHIRFKFIF